MTNQEEIYIYEVVEGDFNDVFSRQTIRATEEQIEKYIKDQFSDVGKEKMQDLGTDSIGYGVYYEDDLDLSGENSEYSELRLQYYIEDVNIDRDYDNAEIDLDLTVSE